MTFKHSSDHSWERAPLNAEVAPRLDWQRLGRSFAGGYPKIIGLKARAVSSLLHRGAILHRRGARPSLERSGQGSRLRVAQEIRDLLQAQSAGGQIALGK